MYLATAGGGCAAICGGSPVKLPGFETSFEIFVRYLQSTSELYLKVTIDFSIQLSELH